MAKFNFRNDAPEVFRHPNNIYVGKGRILWANATTPEIGDYKNVALPEGWVLPGGRRTTDFDEAYAWAVMIDNHHVRNTRKMMYDQIQNTPIKESSVTHSHLWIDDLYGKEKNT